MFKDTSGKGTAGMDDAYAKDYFANIGAEIMGAGKFGLHNFPDDPNWKGWWGDEPPFGCPVFVLTHKRRPFHRDGRWHHVLLHRDEPELTRCSRLYRSQTARMCG